MSLTNTHRSYGWVAIALHWISAVGVIVLYFLGEALEEAPRAAKAAAFAQHVSVGMLLITFLAARLIWTATQTTPEKLEHDRRLRIVAAAVQGLLMLMILIQIVTGPLVIWSMARPIVIYDWVQIAGPFSAKVPWLHEAAETLHKLAPNALWPLLGLHVLGVAKHVILNRDATLKRMLWSH